MDMICPECYGHLERQQDGVTATCPLHGGCYRILFSKAGVHPVPGPPPFPKKSQTKVPSPSTTCYQHPNVRAGHLCEFCGAPICTTCAFSSAGGGFWCPDCAITRGGPSNAAGRAPNAPLLGMLCAVHHEVAAVALCKGCGAGVCATCDFQFPGNIHLCPTCVVKTDVELTPKAQSWLYWSIATATWSTLVLVVIMAGALEGAVTSYEEQMVLGFFLMAILYAPVFVGVGLAFNVYESRRKNPPLVWVSVVWNSVLTVVLVLLMIAGLFM